VSSKRFRARLDKVEAPIRDRYATAVNPPADPREAFIWALDSGRLTQDHFEAVWQQIGPRLRDETVQRARERRVTRLIPDHKENFHVRLVRGTDPVVALVEIASLHPNETPDLHDMRCIECFAKDPIEYLFPETNPKRPFLRDWMQGHLALRILGSSDGLELRRQIWDAPTLLSPPIHRL
jgi:hypothetical protein